MSAVEKCVEQKYRELSNRRGIVAAIVDANTTKQLTFGQARVDQIFEIGSITKTFTANLLAQDVLAGNLKLSDHIPSQYQKTKSLPITYQHLTTHTSGIIPGNFPDFKESNPKFPYEGLTTSIFKELYKKTSLAKDAIPGKQWSYSNIGISLLGMILAENNQASYERLVADKIFRKLDMKDSYFQVPETEKSRFPTGNVNGQAWPHWDLFSTAIDPAGGIRSTISDMAKYARANLLPASSSLGEVIKLTHQPLYYIDSKKKWIGMNWIIEPEKNLVWHNGSTVGFNSILAISVKHGIAVIALTDTGIITTDKDGHETADDSLKDIAFACLE